MMNIKEQNRVKEGAGLLRLWKTPWRPTIATFALITRREGELFAGEGGVQFLWAPLAD